MADVGTTRTSDPVELRAFAADAQTERTLRRALADTPLAEIRRAGLPDALAILAGAPPTKLVVVDLDGAPDPEAAMTQLRAVCSFGTEFVAMGSLDTSGIARKLLHDGFVDYLTKPVSVVELRDACSTALEDLPGREYAGRVIGFAGSGGSGVAAMVAAVARECRARRLNCVILSLDPIFAEAFALKPSGNLSELLLGIEDGSVSDFDPFDQGDGRDSEGIALVSHFRADSLPAPSSPDSVLALIRHLANRSSTVLLGGIPDPELLAAVLKQSDVRVVLYEPTLLSINVAVRCLALVGADHPSIVVQCHPRLRRSSLSQGQIRYAFGDREPDLTLPYDGIVYKRASLVDAPPAASRRFRKALSQAVDRILARVR